MESHLNSYHDHHEQKVKSLYIREGENSCIHYYITTKRHVFLLLGGRKCIIIAARTFAPRLDAQTRSIPHTFLREKLIGCERASHPRGCGGVVRTNKKINRKTNQEYGTHLFLLESKQKKNICILRVALSNSFFLLEERLFGKGVKVEKILKCCIPFFLLKRKSL